ncbi:ergothioneine biosynthesis protein EgtB [Rubrivivax gelatinosus]|uniref:Sulfatase maturase n=1 Tax=Rubrivivax gelatinosus TaxID=28068 RepID=A0ABS1DNQ9_RUBGE|nr:ergothioneine biosynthesis protein EgtB [Rubrivivax gelatinosus]MBK1711642.1 sulfatase maturase [Rubrivivax gelatinosus]
MSDDDQSLGARLRRVRAHSEALAAPLSPEDQALQAMPDASPTKWHLAHTSWFFEAIVLGPHAPGFRPHDERWARLFNSYYESLGPRHPRPQRGMLSRPSLAEVLPWRHAVDEALAAFIAGADADTRARAWPLIELGLQHEQQHQELIQTDLLAALALNPLAPAAWPGEPPPVVAAEPGWLDYAGGSVEIGHGGGGFAFDNETPRHRVLLQPYRLANRLVSNAEYQAFVDDAGYRRAALWLSDGWAVVQAQGWTAPLYWRDGGLEFTLYGERERQPEAPVRHLSFYEAAAFAEWAGARLPSEAEWEHAATSATPPAQCFGAVWQWTRSSYDPYPRFRPLAGAVGEYNGKFMVGQIVLRGSSVATPAGHARASYRNFFPPAARWQYSGLRLALDA